MTDKLELYHDLTSIEKIQVIQRDFSLPIDEKTSRVKKTPIYFEVSISTNCEIMDATNNSFSVVKNIGINVLSEFNSVIAKIAVAFSFLITDKPAIDNNEPLISLTDNKYMPNIDINEWLDHVVIATTRGILVSEFRGTFIENTVLPLLKPSFIRRAQ